MFNLSGGQFLYSNGLPIAGGTLNLALSGAATIIATGGAAPMSYTFALDADGVIAGAAPVWGNAELSPAGTYYVVTVTVGSTVVWGPFNWAVGPANLYSGNLYPNVTLLSANAASIASFTSQRTVTSNFSILTTDQLIKVNAGSSNVIGTLPSAVGNAGLALIIKRVDAGSGTVTIQTTGGQTIDGLSSWLLDNQWQTLFIVSDGANWVIIGGY